MARTRSLRVRPLLAVLLLAACGKQVNGGSTPTSTLPVTTVPSATTAPPTTEPATTTTLEQYYEVQPGDSLSAIAAHFDVKLADLVAINEITDPNKIQAGQKLLIPPPTVLITSLPSTSLPLPVANEAPTTTTG